MIRRAIPISVAAAFVALLAISWPALSLRAYQPDPVDFEVAPARSDVKAIGGGGQTVSVRAPKRFNLVGARWRGKSEPRLKLRVRRSGGEWSKWTDVAAHAEHAPDPGRPEGHGGQAISDPVWVGEGDELQMRSSERLPGLRMHFVNAKGTATAADRAKTAVRSAVNGAVLAVARPFNADLARAADQPPIVPRSGWGAENCPPRRAPSYGQVKAAFVHHTVSMNNYSPQDSPAMVLAICRYHRNSNGWDDIGYTFLVDKYGTIFEGRAGGVDQAVIGAHTQGYNSQSTGISNIGDFRSVPQSNAAIDAMARLIRWKLELHGQPTAGPVVMNGRTFDRISGHRDANSTACPGDALYAQLPELRSRVGGTPGPGTSAPGAVSTRLEATASRFVRFPSSTRVKGRLRLSSGAAVTNAPVDIEQLSGNAWRAVGRTRTKSDGRFKISVPLNAKRTIRARYAGDPTHFASTSPGRNVIVLPKLSLGRSAKQVPKRQPVAFDGEIGPFRTRLTLIVERLVKGRYRRVATFRPTVQRTQHPTEEGDVIDFGTFLVNYTPPKTGLYRAVVIFPGDRRFGATRSRTLHVRAVAGAPARR